MPNNTRIHNITDRIGDLWFSKVPNWRFGQMLSNFFSSLHTDPFYVDDNDLLKKLEEFLSGYNVPNNAPNKSAAEEWYDREERSYCRAMESLDRIIANQ